MSQTYLIVGGSSGIGLSLVNKLTSEGNRVIALSRNSEALSSLENVTHHVCDIAADSPTFPEISEPIQGIAYLPGTVNLKPFLQLKIEDFQNDLNINYLGAIKTVQHYIPKLEENSSIVFISTVAVQKGFPLHGSVSGAKGAVAGLTRALAAELAPKVRVNAVAPSLTETPLTSSLLDSDVKKQGSAKRHPMGRVGQPEDIANAIAYLLSKEAGWVTGQVIGVDGGLSVI